jgi:hypothetical protein
MRGKARKRSLREDTERGGQESLGYGARIKQAANYKHNVFRLTSLHLLARYILFRFPLTDGLRSQAATKLHE